MVIDNKKQLGQIFTPDSVVDKMISLIRNKGTILEPSAGSGAFFKKIDRCIGIEIDGKYCPDGCLNMDFFDYNIFDKFNTIIGNPPYVKYTLISPDTKRKITTNLFDDRTNLYQYFIERCFCLLEDYGEIIFVTPREFLKATSNIKLNELLYINGTFTHYYDMGDARIFPNAQPNCCIWRYEKDNFSRVTETNDGIKTCNFNSGQILFCSKKYTVNLSDIFDVSVGGVSGADSIFTHLDGNMDFVCSYTKSTGKTKRMIYNIRHPFLEKFKNKLKNRKIKKFNDDTWHMWGRDFNKSDRKRIYVNNKTRESNPFFNHECNNYDGSVLALFIKDSDNDEKILVKMLNKIDWKELGFMCGNRFLFNQKGLQNTNLPLSFGKFVKHKKKKKQTNNISIDVDIRKACLVAINNLVDEGNPFDHIDIISYTRKQLERSTKKVENHIIEYLILMNMPIYLPSNYNKIIINTSMSCNGPICQYIYFSKLWPVDRYIKKDKQAKENLYSLTKENRVQIPFDLIKKLGDIEQVIIDDRSNPTYILALNNKNIHMANDISTLKANKDVRISSTMMKEKYNFLPKKISITQNVDGIIKISPQMLL